MQYSYREYTYTVQFVKGMENGNADALSKLPLPVTNTIYYEICGNFFLKLNYVQC